MDRPFPTKPRASGARKRLRHRTGPGRFDTAGEFGTGCLFLGRNPTEPTFAQPGDPSSQCVRARRAGRIRQQINARGARTIMARKWAPNAGRQMTFRPHFRSSIKAARTPFYGVTPLEPASVAVPRQVEDGMDAASVPSARNPTRAAF
jgi:hypothetical protein